MKTNLKKLFLLAIILITPSMVWAASSCSYSEQAELNNIVANVKATYEATDVYAGKTLDIDSGKDVPEEVDYYIRGLKISILNVTNDIYIKVSDKNSGAVQTYYFKDTNNGNIEFTTTEVDKLNTYTIDIYSNKYSCAGEKFKTFSLPVPMYNFHSQMKICDDYPNYYYCQEFISSENINADFFYDGIEKYKKTIEQEQEEEKNKDFIDKLKDFYNNNKLIIYSIGIVIVVAGVATTVILIKKKRSRVL